MNIEVEQLSNVERKITVQIPWETVQEELDAAYRGLQKRARVRGFRPGKVPRKVLEQYYRQTVEGEVVGRLVDEGFRNAVEAHELFPISQPSLEAFPDVQKGEELRFIATVEVKPEIKVKSVEGLSVERKIREVTPEEIEAELLALREKATIIEAVEDREEAEAGDLTVIDFFGFVGGETFKGGKGINYTVEIGANQMVPGFEEQLVGMRIGEEKTFVLQYPESEGAEEARGREVEWKVELKELKRKLLPDLDDEFAKDLGEYDSLDELRAGIQKNLSTREDAKSRRHLRQQVLDALVEANPFEVPDSMVERQIEFILQDTLRFVQDQKDPRVLEVIQKIKIEARPSAEKQVAGMLLLEGVARDAELSVTDEELEGRLQDLSREHRIPIPQLKKQLAENDQLGSIRYNLLQDKALDHVVDRAEITEVTVSAEEFDKAESSEAADVEPEATAE